MARIQLTFNAQVVTSPNSKEVASVRSGKGKIVAQITFTKRAVNWAFIDKDRAVAPAATPTESQHRMRCVLLAWSTSCCRWLRKHGQLRC